MAERLVNFTLKNLTRGISDISKMGFIKEKVD